jgi:CRP-like cAMP-binding protein
VSVVAEDLKRVPLFAELDDRQLKKLAQRFRERILLQGTTPVREGTMSGIGFFVLADGEASVSIGGKVLRTLGRGDHFGELALVNEAERTATITADTDLRVLEIPFYDFREFAMANPDVMWSLLQHVVALLDRNPRTE